MFLNKKRKNSLFTGCLKKGLNLLYYYIYYLKRRTDNAKQKSVFSFCNSPTNQNRISKKTN